MKVSTIAATSIIAASTAVSGNEVVTNLRKLETTTSESGNKFRKLDGSIILECDDDGDEDSILKKDCYEEKPFGCKGKDCPKYEICVKCDGGAGVAFNFAIGVAGISYGLVLASDDGDLDGNIDNSFCASAFFVGAGDTGIKYETKCASDQGSFELEVKFDGSPP